MSAILAPAGSGQPPLTFDDFLAIERCSQDRAEFDDGVRFLLPPISPAREAIVRNVAARFQHRLERQSAFRLHSLNVLAYSAPANCAVYPDILVSPSPPMYYDSQCDVVLAPRLVLHVLQASLARRLRTHTFAVYRSLPSLTDLIFISLHPRGIESFSRPHHHPQHWLYNGCADRLTLHLGRLSLTLTAGIVYRGLTDAADEA